MQAEFNEHIENNFSNLLESEFLLACSGGLDSVVLAHLCVAAKLNFSLAHCNFRLRGDQSEKDEKFVQYLAKKLNKKLHITHFDTKSYMNINKVNIQTAARDLRYAWFAELMHENGINTLVTAHHADDNLETFIINLSRGTGIDGLTGIPEKTERISRPLLHFSRAQILAHAKSEHLKWREDASNSDTKYLRNKIRHEIIPVLKELHPAFLENFKMTNAHVSGATQILNTHIALLKTRCFQTIEGGYRIAIDELAVLHPQKAYLYAILKDYGFKAWQDIVRLLNGLSGKEIRSKTHRLIKDHDHLLLVELQAIEIDSYHIVEGQTEIKHPFSMRIAGVNMIDEKGKNILYVAKEALKYPLSVRKWQKGDYFYPFGMTGKKKLSKYFKDEKMSLIAKEKQWLLCSDHAIVWVIGQRADQRFAVSADTEQILKFTVQI